MARKLRVCDVAFLALVASGCKNTTGPSNGAAGGEDTGVTGNAELVAGDLSGGSTLIDDDAGTVTITPAYDPTLGPTLVELRREGARAHFVRYAVTVDTAGMALMNGDSERGTNFRGCGFRILGADAVARLTAVFRANDAMSLHTGEIPKTRPINRKVGFEDGKTTVAITLDGQTHVVGYFGSLADGNTDIVPGEEQRVRTIVEAVTTITGVDPWNPDTFYAACVGLPNDRGQGPDPPPFPRIKFSLQLQEDATTSRRFLTSIRENEDGSAAMRLSVTDRSKPSWEACPQMTLTAAQLTSLKGVVKAELPGIPRDVPPPRNGHAHLGTLLDVIVDDVRTSAMNHAGPGADPKLDALVAKLKTMTPLGAWEKKGTALPRCVRPTL